MYTLFWRIFFKAFLTPSKSTAAMLASSPSAYPSYVCPAVLCCDQDGNMGLVKQAVTALTKRKIMQLTHTYITLRLSGEMGIGASATPFSRRFAHAISCLCRSRYCFHTTAFVPVYRYIREGGTGTPGRGGSLHLEDGRGRGNLRPDHLPCRYSTLPGRRAHVFVGIRDVAVGG